MDKYNNQTFVGERALYNIKDSEITNSVFKDGESPLKETKNISLENSQFEWKYPLWYSKHIKCENVKLLETARSGIWYTDDIEIINSIIDAPKTFRRAKNITLKNVTLNNALETFWTCKYIQLVNITAKGDYFGMNSSNIAINNFKLDGNYCFDGGKNIYIRNAVLNSKDSFWNCKNVTVCDSIIIGEYIGWNSKDITFINCKIASHQGLCYMKNLKMINCELIDTDLCFELCENIDADIVSHVTSIKNPISGKIHVKSVGELILDESMIDKNKTKIIIDEKI